MLWHAVPGFSNYEVSETGIVRKTKASKRLPVMGQLAVFENQAGYARCKMVRDDGVALNMAISHVVAISFIGPRPSKGFGVLHKDDNRRNNCWGNLYWGTPKQNTQDAIKNGRIGFGEKGWNAKLTNEQARYIRRSYKKGAKKCNIRALARELGVGTSTVHRVVHNVTFKDV